MTKQEILDYLDNVLHPIVSPDNWNVYSELHDMIEELPSAEPIRHGKWRKVDYQICVGKGAFVDALECSVCEEPNYEMSNYCPRCGARMDEDEISNIARESAYKIFKALYKVMAKGMQKQNIKEDDEP